MKKKCLAGILFWLFFSVCISLLLGVVDCWVAGTSHRDTLFSMRVWKLSDGGTSGYIGLGYSLTYYRKMDGEQGPEIWYWYLPFSIYDTSERTGMRWLFASDDKEPAYKGRTLSQWLNVYFSGYSGYSSNVTPEENEAARQAIVAMGTNSIPTLIGWLSEDHPDMNQRGTATAAFQILGKKAWPAAPALIKLTKNKDKDIRSQAFLSLLAIKPEKEVLVPALAQLARDPDKSLAYEAACELINLDAGAAKKAGIFNLFPQFTYAPDLEQMQTNATNNIQNQ